MNDAQTTQPPPTLRSAGFRALNVVRVLQSAGGSLAVQALLHAQLARIEWEQEKVRLLKMLAVTLLGFAALLCLMIFVGVLVVATTWGTPYGHAAIAGLLLLYGAGTAIAWKRFMALSALGGEIFTTSLQELAADAALLKAQT